MVRASLLGVVVLVATEASADSAPRQPAFDEAELISGACSRSRRRRAPVAMPTRDEAFALDAEMTRVRRAVRGPTRSAPEAARIDRALEERGMFSLDYSEITRTASATFHERQGNCLSFTMLFVGARARGRLDGDVSERRGAADLGERRPSRHREPRECRRPHRARRRDHRRLQHSHRPRRPAQPPRQRHATRSGCSTRTSAPKRCCAGRMRQASSICARPRACIPTSRACG